MGSSADDAAGEKGSSSLQMSVEEAISRRTAFAFGSSISLMTFLILRGRSGTGRAV